jgi:hypothetical protein
LNVTFPLFFRFNGKDIINLSSLSVIKRDFKVKGQNGVDGEILDRLFELKGINIVVEAFNYSTILAFFKFA